MLNRAQALPVLTPVIAGPTAGGKSDLAVAVALGARERLGVEAEIVTADAFQVYRGMDIGTAKPTVEERRGVPHHLLDLVSPSLNGTGGAGGLPSGGPRSGLADTGGQAARAKAFTVEDWRALATAKIDELRGAGRLPIVVGGTHLYIKALLDGLFEGPEPDPGLRAELTAMAPGARRAELERVDPAAAARIHPNDVRRTVRALEVFRQTGRPISAHQRQWDAGGPSRSEGAGEKAPGAGAASGFLLVILDWEVEALNRRINARVRQMIDRGLLGELRDLLALGPLAPQPAEALGYKQLLPLLAPGSAVTARPEDIEGAVERIKIETRRFGKNQRTWLKRLRTTPGALDIPCPATPEPERVERVLAALKLR